MRARAAEKLNALLMNLGKDFSSDLENFENSLTIFTKNSGRSLYLIFGLTRTFPTDLRFVETEARKGGAMPVDISTL